MGYRGEARRAIGRAKEHLRVSDTARLRYAALELRMALECLIYERAELYKGELAGKKLNTWQPRKLLGLLLEIDPNADKSGSLSVGLQIEPGKPAPETHSLGQERTLTLEEIKTYYDRLGSYLHVPTIDQVLPGKGATQDQMKRRCSELIRIVDEVLNSPVFNINFRRTTEKDCDNCGTRIVRRLPVDKREVVASCIECSAEYELTYSDSGLVTWRPLVQEVKCANDHCKHVITFWIKDIEQGARWTCEKCHGRNTFALGVLFE